MLGRIPQFVAWSHDGPTFTADIHGLMFECGVCGPIGSAMAERARMYGMAVLPVDPGDEIEWSNDPQTGWTLKAIPARAAVDLGRLIVLDPDNPPDQLPPAALAFVRQYDLRGGHRKAG